MLNLTSVYSYRVLLGILPFRFYEINKPKGDRIFQQKIHKRELLQYCSHEFEEVTHV